MLYDPTPFDFSRDALVVVHIPKTGGNSLADAIFDRLGQENCRFIESAEKAGKIQLSRLHKAAWSAKEALRRAKFWARGGAPRMGDRDSRANVERALAFDGHYALGREPRNSRKPVYITVVRDPVDRFLSNYFMAQDNRAKRVPGERDRHPFWTYDLDRFVDYVYARRKWNDINMQCRFLGGVGRFEPARRAVDECMFLAAPTNRLDDCLELLQPVLDLKSTVAPRSNVGQARRGKPPPSPETRAKIEEMTSEDRHLFDYVSRAFDGLYREFAGARRVA